MGEERFLTTKEVAKHFGITDRTVRRHIKRGMLPAIALHAKQWLIKETDLTLYRENLEKLKKNVKD